MATADIFRRRETHFVLWRVARAAPPPKLVIGTLELGAPVALIGERAFELQRVPGFDDLWAIAAADCDLLDDAVYHYWFEVTDAHPQRPGARIRVTDPFAHTVDWRVLGPRPEAAGYGDDERYPAAVVKHRGARLVPCDAGGETAALEGAASPEALAPNNRLVIYEVPTAWARLGSAGERELGVGTFRDVAALVDPRQAGRNFADLAVLQPGRAYLAELGINAIELLPPADSFYARQWGYGTTNFFAPDFELGYPGDYSWPASNRDLAALVDACHRAGIRFFADVVMAFARTHAYLAAATDDFFILDPAGTPTDADAHNSRQGGARAIRNGFGSSLFRYAKFVTGYDPVSGERRPLSPARELMKASVMRWIADFHIDGIRMDSVENVCSWDFIEDYKDLARAAWKARFPAVSGGGTLDERFLVVGEELHEPLDLLRQHRLDGLWHESFKKHIRAALLGENAEGEPSFEWTVRKAIDCRNLGYRDGAQAVIYLTSHDVEGYRNERLCNFLQSNGVADVEKRIKLAFACLLTAVGTPMILAGDEFADQHDLFDASGHVTQQGGKQVDPVNYSRLGDEWRRRIKEYVARLVAFRTRSDALAVNDTEFIHVDFDDGKRVLAWRRGRPDSGAVVVVVANFSDFASEAGGEYRVPNWPATPPGRSWREVSQARDVPPEWVAREPIFPWEAKVYALV